jgi:hypothetical protein
MKRIYKLYQMLRRNGDDLKECADRLAAVQYIMCVEVLPLARRSNILLTQLEQQSKNKEVYK